MRLKLQKLVQLVHTQHIVIRVWFQPNSYDTTTDIKLTAICTDFKHYSTICYLRLTIKGVLQKVHMSCNATPRLIHNNIQLFMLIAQVSTVKAGDKDLTFQNKKND